MDAMNQLDELLARVGKTKPQGADPAEVARMLDELLAELPEDPTNPRDRALRRDLQAYAAGLRQDFMPG